MRVVIKCDDYEIKTAKAHTTSCRVGVPKRFVNQNALILPLTDEVTIKKNENEFLIITEAQTVLNKFVKERNNTGIVFIPIEYNGCDVLITKAPNL